MSGVCSRCSECKGFFGRFIPGVGLIHDCASDCYYYQSERDEAIRKAAEKRAAEEAAAAAAKEAAFRKEVAEMESAPRRVLTSPSHTKKGWEVSEVTLSDGRKIWRHKKGKETVFSKSGILPVSYLEKE